jgi:cell division protein FtsW (lipid II flippase)
LAEEGITEHVCAKEDSSAKNWLFIMMESMPRDEFAKVAVTLWSIWYARRKIIHDEEFQSPLCLPISSFKVTSGTYLLPLAVAKQQRLEGKQSILAGSHPKQDVQS